MGLENVDFREILTQIADVLEAGGQPWVAGVLDALAGSDETLETFLVSNDLWGGSGSIADSAFADDPSRPDRFIELMIRLGRMQIAAGRTNVRTGMWVTAFEKWPRTSGGRK